MLPMLEPIKNQKYDCLTFLPSRDDNVNVEASVLIERGEKIGGSSMGDSYDIVLFKEGDEGPTHIDRFSAILGCPLEYISFLIPAGWYGLIVRKTTTSDEIGDDLMKQLVEETA